MKLIRYKSIELCKDRIAKHLIDNSLPYTLIVQSEFGNGKSGCLDYISQFVDCTLKKSKYPCLPTINIVMPPAPGETRIYNAILEKLNIPYTNKEPNDNKLKQITLVMDNLATKMLAIDDLDMLSHCSPSQIEQTLFGIIQIVQQLNLALVMTTSDSFNLGLIESLTRKLKPEVISLPRWDSALELETFVREFLEVEKGIDEHFLAKLSSYSDRNLDNIVQILNSLKAHYGPGDDCVTYNAIKNFNWNSHTKRLSRDLW